MSSSEVVPDPERDAALAYGQELEIAALKGNAGLKVLLAALEEAEKGMALTIGGNVLSSVKAVDQRKLDYARGYYAGARYWLRGRVVLAEQRVAQFQAEHAGQDDPRPTGQDDPRAEGVEDA